MLSDRSSIVAIKETVFSDLGDEVAILNLRSGAYFGLNPVGAFIWSRIQEPRTMGDLCRAVEGEFEVDHDRCAHDIAVLIDELRTNGLIDVEENG
jgi:hypothetical protein